MSPGAAPFRKEGGVCHVAGDWSVLALAQPGEVERRREAMARAAGGEACAGICTASAGWTPSARC